MVTGLLFSAAACAVASSFHAVVPGRVHHRSGEDPAFLAVNGTSLEFRGKEVFLSGANQPWVAYGSDFGNYGSSLVNVTGSSGSIAIGPYSVLVLSRQALPGLDSDGDGLLNGWEQTYFGSPVAGVATSDSDGDGANNLHEQAANTAPNSAASILKFTNIQHTGANVALQWTGGQSVKQLIQHATTLSGPWTAIFTNYPPTAITNSLIVSNVVSSPRYYRVQIAP